MGPRSILVLLGVGLILGACATPRARLERWEAQFGREHPLTGRIWEVAAHRFVEPETLVGRLVAVPFVLLGEHHNNPDHHRLQARLVRALVAAGRRPAVAFEMFSVDQAPAIAGYLATAPQDAAGLGEAVGWARSGWPDWRFYEPIAQAALDAGLPIVAANLSPASARALARGQPDTLERALVARWELDRPLSSAISAVLARDIEEGHCGQAPEALIPGMMAAQRARDAQMAERLLEAETDGAVLIAGAGHVRTDWGVPTYLRVRRPQTRVASLAFLEVRPDRRSPGEYAGSPDTTVLPFDFVWFTPRADDADPCEKFSESLQRLREYR